MTHRETKQVKFLSTGYPFFIVALKYSYPTKKIDWI